MSDKITSILDGIAELTVLELSELKTAFEEKFDVEAAAPMAMAMPAAGGGDGGGEDAGPSSYNVILKESGSSKIPVIKEVRAITGLGLKEAKEMVDNVPKAIKEGVSKDEGEEVKTKLEAVGAVVELEGA
jgi:large subunit ribosomal protein L7/L12